MMEANTHCYLLRIANQVAKYDPDLALLYVGAYSLSTFGCSIQRSSKPFTPMLGETFEYVDTKRGIKYVSEQVSHHPPISACYIEDENFQLTSYFRVATRFTGNAVEVEPASTNSIILKSTGVQYTFGGIRSVLNNLFVGTMWMDMYGDITVQVSNSKRVFKLNCVQCGWFSAGWHECSGEVLDEKNQVVFSVIGKWNETIYATRKRNGKSTQPIPREKNSQNDCEDLNMDKICRN